MLKRTGGKRGCAAHKWSLWQSFVHEALSKRCSVCFVDLVCFSQNCNSITQVGVVVSLWSRIDWDHSLCRMTRPCHLWEGISHAVFIGERVSPHLTAALSGFELQRCFFFSCQSCWTLGCKENNTKLPTTAHQLSLSAFVEWKRTASLLQKCAACQIIEKKVLQKLNYEFWCGVSCKHNRSV